MRRRRRRTEKKEQNFQMKRGANRKKGGLQGAGDVMRDGEKTKNDITQPEKRRRGVSCSRKAFPDCYKRNLSTGQRSQGEGQETILGVGGRKIIERERTQTSWGGVVFSKKNAEQHRQSRGGMFQQEEKL